MQSTQDIKESRLADAWAELQHAQDNGEPLTANSYRLAFADPEFLLRRETRGIRFQLEMLKPDVELAKHGIDETIVVFGSARFLPADEAAAQLKAAQASGDAAQIAKAQRAVKTSAYYEMAREFGSIVARYSNDLPESDRLFICTGGGPGIMEAANRGAFEAGAPSVGLNITLPHEQSGNRFIAPHLNFKFHYFALRKMHLMMRAKALVTFPGGFGTMDELFEVLTLVQTKKAKPVPIVLFGSDYWKRFLNFDVLVEEGTISEQDLNLFHYTDSPQEAWQIIKNFYKLA